MADVYKWKDIYGGTHYGAPMVDDPPEAPVDDPKVEQQPLGGYNTPGRLYYIAPKTDSDKAEVKKREERARRAKEYEEYVAAQQAKRAREAAAAEEEYKKKAHTRVISGAIDIDCGVEHIESLHKKKHIQIGKEREEADGSISHDVVNVDAKKGAGKIIGEKAKYSPVNCKAGATISVSPGDLAQTLQNIGVKKISDDDVKAVEKTSREVAEMKKKAEDFIEEKKKELIEEAKEKAIETAQDAMKKE